MRIPGADAVVQIPKIAHEELGPWEDAFRTHDTTSAPAASPRPEPLRPQNGGGPAADELARLRQENAGLRRRNAELEQENARLRGELDLLLQSAGAWLKNLTAER
ncbi:hypothetical protein E1286_36945 [Nonomuraea terrae]|uniref:Uncharacterized protein n=1 Tax=Nonomuraea terrae TaxID=2530383 RepID=A0A4R4Y0T8_9ACTN|nr:hypothetical protein E1286_36945 [Nonomuraea terrae]